MTLKSIMIGAIFALSLGSITVATSHADDMPYGYSVVKETPEKGEKSRTKTLNTDKELVGRKIEKDDGTYELHAYKKDVLTQKIVYNKDGSRHAVFDYYADGKLKREVVKDKLRFERRKLADGTYEAIRYKADGERPQMRRRVSLDGGFELTHYRTGKSDGVWFTATVKGVSGNFEWQYFAEDGSHLRRVITESEMVVTVYDKHGNFKLEQVWTPKDDGSYNIKSSAVKHNDGYRRYSVDAKGVLSSVEDLDSDGSVKFTWKPDQVDKPAAGVLTEQFPDDDHTIPGTDE